ncbi:hypothetical protein P691DRAFT_760315 [Macrolepiota fuliginosa MF-IS2]|uniref:Uncharacterized protein n=1 Tax=Macrolepiota fuliginosa MF-IS2 TaxID=1400762 RepID=A0A9P5XDS2_9AGAR|nr:hypothetical protein P691DRAFT_760315 [Macrolepiota fuliginosa MF-IS2]
MAFILDSLYNQMSWTIGAFISSFLAGSLIPLGISCILLMTRGKERISKQHRYLCIYIVALLFFIILFEVEVFLVTAGVLILYPQSPHKAQVFLDVVMIVGYSTLAVLCALSDGLLVWRCFMIHRGLRHSLLAKYGHVIWIFPACLLGLSLVTGYMSAGMFLRNRALSDKLGAVAFASNAVLNLYATTLITATLLIYRRTVKFLTGSATNEHLPIIAIFLQSAATNVPMTVAAAIGVWTGKNYGMVVGIIIVATQALTSILIIHQVALGRVFGHGGEEQLLGMTSIVFRRCEGNEQDSPDCGV